jgi:hypothetical protein
MPCWIDPGEGVFRRGWLLEESSGSDGRRLQRDGSGGDCASLRVAHFSNLAPGTTPGPSVGPSPLPLPASLYHVSLDPPESRLLDIDSRFIYSKAVHSPASRVPNEPHRRPRPSLRAPTEGYPEVRWAIDRRGISDMGEVTV